MIKNKYVKSFAVPIILILITNVIQYSFTKYQLSHDEKKQYINKQLNEFYLPLKNDLHSSKLAWNDFNYRFISNGSYENIKANPGSKEALNWRIFMLNQFKPIHNDFEHILKKRDLALDNKDLNEELDVLERHINDYKVITYQWSHNSVASINISPIHFPNNLESSVDKDILRLKSKLSELE